MGFINNVLGIDFPWKNNSSSTQDLNNTCEPYEIVGYRKLAIEMASDLIGNSVSRVEWREFKRGKQDDGKISYLLNTRPNQYSTKQAFFKKITRTLLLRRECLIIHIGNELHIAESFQRTFKNFNTVEYTNIQINGFSAPQTTYKSNSVIYINLESPELSVFLNAYQSDYDKLVKSATNGYQTNKLKKYYLDSDAYHALNTQTQLDFNELVEQNFKTFINSTQRASVYAKPKGYTINKLEDAQQETANDIRNLIEDVFKTTGNTFHIPPTLLITGEATQIQTDNYLMFAVYPIVDAFNQAFNNYMYSESEIRNKTLVYSDVSKTKMIDLEKTADFIAKVFPTGALTLNDVIVRYLNLDTPPDNIGDIRVITKNYDKVENFANGTVNDTTNVTESTVIEDSTTEMEDNTDGN